MAGVAVSHISRLLVVNGFFCIPIPIVPEETIELGGSELGGFQAALSRRIAKTDAKIIQQLWFIYY